MGYWNDDTTPFIEGPPRYSRETTPEFVERGLASQHNVFQSIHDSKEREL